MLDLGYLIVTLLKASIQAAVYATVLLVLARLWARYAPDSRVAKYSSNRKLFWWSSAAVASMVLFFVANTSWGDHGSADHARIPLGHGLAMEEINGSTAYFEPVSINDQSEQIAGVASYQVANDVLCAKMNDGSCFTYHLSTKQYQAFTDSTRYNAAAKELGLPPTTQFASFSKHYIRYWEGWRLWFLA
ncbi:hypothetical protein [Hymenobacter cellulosilyticus]|uniref:Uncharacterized protein n=1 Tax=Hymenobacter cellulosilyticus TaxID=2932248 RepID=A0A8T9QE15_9BACT|nr:hypothetical protein [Hymenobacter cellulosilyticus]UOQ73053.1 hypothetical protein MUN79_03505 [Hymenobacter cellulosilyticus]